MITLKLPPLPNAQNGGKNHRKNINKFGGSIILISQSIQYITRCSGTFRRPCICACIKLKQSGLFL